MGGAVKKSNRGGRRPGQGRPTKKPGVYRIKFATSLHPDTLKKIDAERGALSRGEVIDRKFLIDSK